MIGVPSLMRPHVLSQGISGAVGRKGAGGEEGNQGRRVCELSPYM